MQGLVSYTDRILYVLAFIYGGYSWYSYSGLYRVFAEWQLDTFGEYEEKTTLAAMVLVLAIPVALARRLLRKPAQASAPSRWSRLSSSPPLLAGLGALAICAAAAVGWIAYGKTQEHLEFESVDLNAGQTPASRHVIVTATAQPDLALVLTKKRTESTGDSEAYVPLTPSTWRRGEPVVYFLKTKPDFVRGKDDPFPVTTPPSAVMSGSLPGPIRELYRREGIEVAEPPIVIDTNPRADTTVYFLVALLSGFLGIGLLSTAVRLAWQQRGTNALRDPVPPH